MERTLVLIKPDGVRSKVIGAVISRFEGSGFRIAALKMLAPTRRMASRHYVMEKEWYENMWRNTKKSYEARGEKIGETPLEMGTRVRTALIESLSSGAVVAMVVEGKGAVSAVREICGATEPVRASPSSIRGMYSDDSYKKADREGRAVRNVVHASDSAASASREIRVWFSKKELIDA